MKVRPSVKPLGSHAGLSNSSIRKLWLGVLCNEPLTWVPASAGAAADRAGALWPWLAPFWRLIPRPRLAKIEFWLIWIPEPDATVIPFVPFPAITFGWPAPDPPIVADAVFSTRIPSFALAVKFPPVTVAEARLSSTRPEPGL